MQRKEDLVNYDFQGWPIFKQNLKEILLSLGGKIENDKIIFNLNDPYLESYPITLVDDGMAYGIDESYITDVFRIEIDEEKGINIFIESKPTKKVQQHLFDRWDSEQELANKIIEENESR